MPKIVKSNKKFLLTLCTLSVMMCSAKFIISNAFVILASTVPGLGAGLGGMLFGGVGLFWSTVTSVASMGASIVVGA